MADAFTDSLPILMYHRIATDGPPGLKQWRGAAGVCLKQWRVSPESFDDQMSALHRAGYQTITLVEWADALIDQRPVQGKRVLLTFDDGYSDFLSAAIPALQRYEFSATMFLVPERIGQTALWDASYGDC